MPGDLEGSPALTFSPLPSPTRRPRRLALARLRAALRGLQARGGRAVLPQPLRPPRPPGGADRRARRHPRRPARGRGPARRHGRDPRLLPPRPALAGSRRSSAAASTASSSPPPRPTTCTTRQHARLAAIAEALVRDARARAQFSGADTRALSIASLRATVEQTVTRDGREIDVVRGRLVDTGEEAALFPGNLPDDPAAILAPARQGAGDWTDAAYRVTRFAPAAPPRRPGDGLPHIRLDRAAEFLIGDRLR